MRFKKEMSREHFLIIAVVLAFLSFIFRRFFFHIAIIDRHILCIVSRFLAAVGLLRLM